MEPKQKWNASRSDTLVERAFQALTKEYTLVGRTHVRVWQAWLLGGIAVGMVTGILFVANRSGRFELSRAEQAQGELQAALSANIHALQGLTLQLLHESDLDKKIEIAKIRLDTLAALIELSPADALKVALSGKFLASFSKEVQPYLEQNVTEEGEVEVFHVDGTGPGQPFTDASSKFLYFIKTTKGENLGMYFAENPPTNLETGDHIRVHGLRVNNTLALSSGGTGSVTTLALANPNTFGPQKTLLMLVNFTDKATQPYTVAAAQSVMNTTSNFDKENSFAQTSLIGVVDAAQPADVAGWFTINQSYTVCNSSNIATLAKQAATAAGFNLSSYTRYVYAFPSNACTWWGLGTVGGNPSSAWVNGSFALKVVGHEMGHNFGLYHSHSQSCAAGTCTTSDYGDLYDIMGNPSSDHFNAFQKERLGWLNYNVSPPITSVTLSGTYTIAPYEINDIQPKALKILKSSGTTNTYYYVEYRAGLGFDSGINAVLVHTGASANSSNLWDLDQVTTISDRILNIGQTYDDPTAGVSITLQSIDSTGANVGVVFGPVVCTPGTPNIAISPSSQWGSPGQALSYTVMTTNTDSSSCSPATVHVSSQLPVGWSQTQPSFDVALLPGQSVNTSVSITSALTAAEGYYTFSETAAKDSLSSSASANYNVTLPDTTSPVVTISSPQDGAILSAKGSISVSASVSDASGIASITIKFDAGTLKTCSSVSSCSAKLPLSKVSSGSHTITVTATDASPAKNTSSKSIMVTKL
ncbi:MAG: Ig-like domain-containing protein [bacterium]|nr:Ig-like domain-containing protein [bacterium]